MLSKNFNWKVNDLYEVNTLLNKGAIPNIISLELVKRLQIKKLLWTYDKYITINNEKNQALEIAQNITIGILGRTLKISATIYNHNSFPLLLGRKTLKKLKVITDWDTGNWYTRLDKSNKV